MLILAPTLSWALTFKNGEQIDNAQNIKVEATTQNYVQPKIFPDLDYKAINKINCISENDFSATDLKRILDRNKNFKIIDNWSDNIRDFAVIDSYLLENLSSYSINPTIENSIKLKEYISILFDNNFAARLGGKHPRDSGQKLRDVILSFLYSMATLQKFGHLSQKEILSFKEYIDPRISILSNVENDRFRMSKCSRHADLFGCQNHTYQLQHVKALYGFLFNNSNYIKDSKKLFQFAINDLKSDGALWREASRSKWAWMYYPHGLAQLIAIAELHYQNGENLYEYKSSEGLDLHNAVEFYVRSLENNELMWKYSKKLAGVNHYDDFRNYKDQNYFNEILNNDGGDAYHQWLYIYAHRFPDHPNTQLAKNYINLYQNKIKWTYHLGFNPQCFYHDMSLDLSKFFADGEYKLEWYWKVEENNKTLQDEFLGFDIIEITNKLEFIQLGSFREIDKNHRSKLNYKRDENYLYFDGVLDLDSDGATSEILIKVNNKENSDGEFEGEGVWDTTDDGRVEIIRVIIKKQEDNNLANELDLLLG